MGYDTINDIPAEYVLFDVCNAQRANNKMSGKGEVEVFCPICPGKKIEVNLAKNGSWHCFRNCATCPGECGGRTLNLVRLFFDCASISEARKLLLNHVNGGDESEKKRIEFCKSTQIREKDLFEIASEEKRDAAYRSFLSHLTLSQVHRKNLHDRGISARQVREIGFKSLPQNGLNALAKKITDEGIDLQGVPGFYTDDKGPHINLYGSGFFIPYVNPNGLITGLQIRHDVEITDNMTEDEFAAAKSRRYRWFTSSNKDGGTGAKNIPFYGIVDKEKPVPKIVYATEGGLKALAAYSLSGAWFTAIPGVNCFTAWRQLLEYYKRAGVKTVVDAFDADRSTNPQVAANIQTLYEIASEYGYEMRRYDWGTEEKGVDDHLLAVALRKKRKKHEQSVQKSE